jgi:hypothetical protein
MTTILFPDQTETVHDIINALGREVEFFLPSYITCSACSLDPVNLTSTNSFCTVCFGKYYIPTYEEVPVTGYVSWGFSEQLGWVQGGQLAEGDCRLQLKYTETNVTLIENVEYLHVDNKKMKIRKKTLRGTPVINRILLDLQELE